jgi:putative membrane protein
MMTTIQCKKTYSALVAVGIATLAVAQDTNLPPRNMAERILNELTAQEFVTDAAMGGMKEVRLSELARDRSQNNEVKSFAQRMIADHSKANQELARLAQQKGLELPGTNTFAADDPNWNNPMISGSEEIKGAYLLKTNLALAAYNDFKQLKFLTGSEFDRTYARDMVMDHVNTVIEFEAASRILTDPDLKKFAQRTLPTLRRHEQMVRKLAGELYGTPAGMDTNDNMNAANTLPEGGGTTRQ